MKAEAIAAAPLFSVALQKDRIMENQKEIWKDIKGYEGQYQISDLGRVNSIERKANTKNNSRRRVRGRILTPSLNSCGYLLVRLSGSKRKTPLIHQLVAMAFLDHNPCKYELVVDHIDFNRVNNNLSNLRIITQRENANQKHLKSSSKYTGVSWSNPSKKWTSCIWIKGELQYLGRFINELDAANAYENAKTTHEQNKKY